MQRGDVYFQTPQIGGASARETEILAFGLCNARLSKANDTRSRIEALHKTHQLWSLLVRDLATDDNRLPKFLKDELIGLGFWAMRYSIAATAEELPLQPLMDVNRNIADGLRAQVSAVSAPSYHPPQPKRTKAPCLPSRPALPLKTSNEKAPCRATSPRASPFPAGPPHPIRLPIPARARH